MNLKKVWLFLLMATISFSAMHDYAFVALEKKHCSVKSFLYETSENAQCETTDTLCEVHVEYHSAFPFVEKSAYIPLIQKRDALFKYKETFLSLNYFNFFKPPIA